MIRHQKSRFSVPAHVGQEVGNTRHTIPNCKHVGMSGGMNCSEGNDTYSVSGRSVCLLTLNGFRSKDTCHVSVCNFVAIEQESRWPGLLFSISFFSLPCLSVCCIFM